MNIKLNDNLPKNENFIIEYLKESDKPVAYPTHFHEYLELYYQLSGERNFFIEDKIYNIKKGDLVLINSYNIHRTTNASNAIYSRISISFRENFLEGFLTGMKDISPFSCFSTAPTVLSLSFNDRTELENLMFKILAETTSLALGHESRIKLLLLDILIFLTRLTTLNVNKKNKSLNPLHKKISEAAQYINSNYTNQLSLKSIAGMFHISPYYFCRIFKEVTGFTYIEYVNTIRIKQAQLLLRESSLNITEISEKAGFESITHFGRVFKHIVGTSPLKYRKDIRRDIH